MHIPSFRLSSLAVRGSYRKRLVLATALFAAGLSGSAWADEYLEPIGGRGGGQFEAHCPANQFLVGFELRAGDDVDAIRPLCAAASGPREIGVAVAEDNWYGGSGGGYTRIACTSYKPIVTGMAVAAEGHTLVVNNIRLYCGLAAETQEVSNSPSAIFDAPKYSGGGFIGVDSGTQHCPSGQVAVGVHGRSGKWLDALGLICGDAPRTAAAPPPPPKVKINPTSTTLKSSGAAAAIGASGTGLKTSGSTGGIGPTGQAGIPANVPPSVPAPPPPPVTPASPQTPPPLSKEEVRNAALKALVETALSTMSKAPPRTSKTARRSNQSMPRSSQPEDSIRIEVRYPMSYGYQDDNGAGPNSCGAFYISMLPAGGAMSPGLTSIDGGQRMHREEDMYVCEYLMSALPRNTRIAVRVAMSDMRAAGSEVWLGGSQAQPPAGQRRTIVPGDRQVVLTASQPRASLRFEMTYTGAR